MLKLLVFVAFQFQFSSFVFSCSNYYRKIYSLICSGYKLVFFLVSSSLYLVYLKFILTPFNNQFLFIFDCNLNLKKNTIFLMHLYIQPRLPSRSLALTHFWSHFYCLFGVESTIRDVCSFSRAWMNYILKVVFRGILFNNFCVFMERISKSVCKACVCFCCTIANKCSTDWKQV